MPQWTCGKGHGMLLPSGPGADQKHLFAILLDPVVIDGRGSKPCVMLAGITSVKNGIALDGSCLIGPGDHPFIQHDSYVEYRYARLEQVDHVEKMLSEGTFIRKEEFSSEVLKRIIQGALQSRRIPSEVKIVLREVLFGQG